jgi:hypothetical protein
MLSDSESKSDELPRSAQSGVSSPIRRYFSWRENCAPDDLNIAITEQPRNGIVRVKEEAYVLHQADLRGGSIGNCAGTKLAAKRLYYTSFKGFVGVDRFSVTVRSPQFQLNDVYDVDVIGPGNLEGPAATFARVPPVTAPSKAPIGTMGNIPMVSDGGTFKVPVTINGLLTLGFVVDSGAADVSIPADVVLTLSRAGTIGKADFLGSLTYRLADGSTIPSQRFIIRSLKVGDKVLENVDWKHRARPWWLASWAELPNPVQVLVDRQPATSTYP